MGFSYCQMVLIIPRGKHLQQPNTVPRFHVRGLGLSLPGSFALSLSDIVFWVKSPSFCLHMKQWCVLIHIFLWLVTQLGCQCGNKSGLYY